MPEVSKSCRAIPRCKGCGQPRKGHSGPTGVTKCLNKVESGDINENTQMNLNSESSNVNVISTDPKDLLIKKSMDFEKDVSVNSSTLEDPQLNSLSIASLAISEVVSEVVNEGLHCAAKKMSGKCRIASICDYESLLSKSGLDDLDEVLCSEKKTGNENKAGPEKIGSLSEDLDISESDHGAGKKMSSKCRISSVCDSENLLSKSALEDLDEVLRTQKKVRNEKKAGPERLGSLSEDLDIRNVVAEKTFLLCDCEKFSSGNCDCKGLLDFNAEMVGVLMDVFDFTPDVLFKKSSWKKKSPNVMNLTLASTGSSPVKGTVTLKAWRLVTVFKGKKHLSIEIEAEIEVKKLKFRKVFQLIEQEVVEEDEGKLDGRDGQDTEDKTSSEDELPSEDSDTDVFNRSLPPSVLHDVIEDSEE